MRFAAAPYILLFRIHRAAIDARRRDRTWRFIAWSALAGVIAALVIAIAAFAAFGLVRAGAWPLALFVVAFATVPIAGGQLLRHVFVPLGWARAAFWTAHLATSHDSDAFALCAAAWAHARRPSPANEAWIIARRDRRRPLGDAEIAVTALLASARGDADGARALLRSLELMVERHPMVREVAGEWLACDAIERAHDVRPRRDGIAIGEAAWRELADDARAARWPASPLTHLLEGIALRRVGESGAPRRAELVARWLVAPHRRTTRDLLAAATPPAVPPTARDAAPPSVDADAADAPTAAPIDRAIRAQLVASAATATSAQLGHAVEAWDVAIGDADVRAWLDRRAIELGAPVGAAERALAAIRTEICDDLGARAEQLGVALPARADRTRGAIATALDHRLRHGRLDGMEAAFTRWAERRRAPKTEARRAAIDEWRELVALRASYLDATVSGGLEVRRLAFPHVLMTGSAMAAWLWNTHEEYALSHAISRWLLAEAIAVGDAEAIDLCTRNCRLAVPTRMGRITDTE